MAVNPFVGANLNFLKEDVELQREIARTALKEARRIEAELQKNPDLPNKKLLEKMKKSLLKMAKELAENANKTSNTAANVITSSVVSTATGV